MGFSPRSWVDGETLPASKLIDLETRVTDYANETPRYPFKKFSNLTWASTTDVTQAINDALTSMWEAETAGILELPPGPATISGSVVVQNRTGIEGQGMWATRLELANSSNCVMVKNYVSPDGIEANAQRISIRNLGLFGNHPNQSSGDWHGIYLNQYPSYATRATNDDEFDSQQIVENVFIYEVKGTGLYGNGRSSTHLWNVQAYTCIQYGIRPSFDTSVVGCVAGGAGLAGFLIEAPSIYMSSCKAFYSGSVTPADGHGFRFNNGGGGTMVGCIAQDNKGAGLYLLNTIGARISGLVCDSNSTDSSDFYPAVYCSGTNQHNYVEFTSQQRANGIGDYQRNALRTSSGTTLNTFVIKHYAESGSTVDGVQFASLTAGNEYHIGPVHATRARGNTSGSITPDFYTYGSTDTMTLNGNITAVNAPAEYHAGQRVRFVFTQNGTGGYTVSGWNAIYKLAGGSLTITSTANKTSVVEFLCDGSSFIEVSRSLNI